MPASLPPNIKFYRIVGGEPSALSELDFGTGQPDQSSITLGPKRVRVANDTAENKEYATAMNPICYMGGTDVDTITDDFNWVRIKNIDDNGVPVSDTFTSVSKSNTHSYKALAGNTIAQGTYVTFDTELVVPHETSAGEYDFDYIIEYQYTT